MNIKKRIAAIVAAFVAVLASVVPASAATYAPEEYSPQYWFTADNMPYSGEYGNDGDSDRNNVYVAHEYQVYSAHGYSNAMSSHGSGFERFVWRYHWQNSNSGLYNLRVYSLYLSYVDEQGEYLEVPEYRWNNITYQTVYDGSSLESSDGAEGAIYGSATTNSGENLGEGSEMPQTIGYIFDQSAYGNAYINIAGFIEDASEYTTNQDVLCIRWRDKFGQRYAYYISLVGLADDKAFDDSCVVINWSEMTLFTNVYGFDAFGDYSAGYNAGYNEGYASGSLEGGLATEEQLAHAEKSGYDKGYSDGRVIGDREGYDRGYSQGLSDGDGIKLDYSTPAASFSSMITGFLTGIGNIITPFLDVEIFGINLKTGIGTLVCLAAIGGLLCVILKVVK